MDIEEPGSTSREGSYPAPPVPEFDTVRRGFAPDQVADYLSAIASKVLSLESRLRETRDELLRTRRERDDARAASEARAEQDPNGEASERVMALVRTFDNEVQQLHRDAEMEAERVLSEVRTESERVLAQARDEAQRIVAEARAEAEAIRADAQTEEQQARLRVGRMMNEARQEADRARTDLADLKESTLQRFRDIRERTLMALGELEAVIEKQDTSDTVVVVEDMEAARADGPQVPRPDL